MNKGCKKLQMLEKDGIGSSLVLHILEEDPNEYEESDFNGISTRESEAKISGGDLPITAGPWLDKKSIDIYNAFMAGKSVIIMQTSQLDEFSQKSLIYNLRNVTMTPGPQDNIEFVFDFIDMYGEKWSWIGASQSSYPIAD